jgi:hypothetical protein
VTVPVTPLSIAVVPSRKFDVSAHPALADRRRAEEAGEGALAQARTQFIGRGAALVRHLIEGSPVIHMLSSEHGGPAAGANLR